MADDTDYPTPGRSEFSADEEKQMRQARAGTAGTAMSRPGSATLTSTNLKTGETTTQDLMMHDIPRSKF